MFKEIAAVKQSTAAAKQSTSTEDLESHQTQTPVSVFHKLI